MFSAQVSNANSVLLTSFSCWFLFTERVFGFTIPSRLSSVSTKICEPSRCLFSTSSQFDFNNNFVEFYDDLEFISDDIEETPVGTLGTDTLSEIPMIIQAWLSRREPERIDRILQRIVEDRNYGNTNAVIDRFTYHLALTAWAQVGRPERVEGLLNTMIEEGVRPNRVTFNICINAWTRSKSKLSGKKAEVLFETMKILDIEPDLTSYNSLLDAFAKASRYGDKDATYRAEQIIENMINSYNDESSDIMPDNISFNSVLDALAQIGSHNGAERAAALLKRMIVLSERYNDKTLFPDYVCFTSLINAWGKSGVADSGNQALRILRQMEHWYDNGYESAKPNLVTFNSVLNAYVFLQYSTVIYYLLFH